MRAELLNVLERLLAASEDTNAVSLDRIGEALGVLAVGADEIDALFAELEARGRRITGPEGGGGQERLRVVIAVARELSRELGRKPRLAEIAERAGLDEEKVRHALALAKVMGR